MTTWEGSYVTAATYNRLRAEFIATLSYPGGALDATDGEATVSWTLKLRKHPSDPNGSYCNDTSDYTIAGDDPASGSDVWGRLYPGDSTIIAQGTDTVPLVYGSTQAWTFSATIDHRVLAGAPKVSGTLTIPARPYYKPAASTGVSVSRVNDGRQDVSWSNNGTTSAPVEKTEVWRNVDGGIFKRIGVVTAVGPTDTYADTSTEANHRYGYKTKAVNSSGSSGYSSTDYVSTTSAQPGKPMAKKDALADINVTRGSLSPIATSWKVRAGDGTVLAADLPPSQTVWKHSDPSPLIVWEYEVAAETDDPVLSSAWSLPSEPVQLLAPPSAPTVASEMAADATEAIVWPWTHNPVDTTSQEAYELRYRAAGGSVWTEPGQVVSGDELETFAADTWTNGQTMELQVRTWGQHPDPSVWSSTSLLVLTARPVVGIVLPGEVQDSPTIVVSWTYHDDEGSAQAAWEVNLRSAVGKIVESQGMGGSATGTVMATDAPDGSTWTIEVRAQDGAGLWSLTDSHTFPVQWAPPPTPTGTAVWYPDDGYAVIRADVGSAGPGEVDADYLQVYRSTDGKWTLVADNLQAGESVTDMTPQTGSVVVYRVVAVSASPSTAYSSNILLDTSTRWVFINYGPGFANLVKVWGNLSAGRTTARHKVLHNPAGAADPIERSGSTRERTYNLQAQLFAPWVADGTSTWDDFEALDDAIGPVLLRDPSGVRMYVSVGPPSESGHLETLPMVSLPLTRVHYSEDEVAL